MYRYCIGSSELFGIKLPENFNTPFFSKTIPEFWRRWHITLNKWFINYIYIPLGGSRKGKIRTYINIMIIFIISGLWHGAAWTYFIWGVLNGIYSCWYRILDNDLKVVLEKFRKIFRLNPETLIYKVIQMFITFGLTCFAFIFFRAESIDQAISMIKSIPNFTSTIGNLGLTSTSEYLITLITLGMLFAVSVLKQKYDIRKEISKQHVIVRYIIWISLIVIILLFGYYGVGYDSSNFIYQKF